MQKRISNVYRKVHSLNIDYLIVAGGGGGGRGCCGTGFNGWGGGGGGAGGVIVRSQQPVSIGTYAITIGNGGPAGNPATN